MRTLALIVVLALGGDGSAAVRPTSSEYKSKTYGRRAVIHTGSSGVVAHLRNTPHEWGRGGAGLAKRVGSSLGTHVVKNTIQYGVAGLRHEDLRYHRSGKHSFGPRMGAALKSTVITRKTTTGKKTLWGPASSPETSEAAWSREPGNPPACAPFQEASRPAA